MVQTVAVMPQGGIITEILRYCEGADSGRVDVAYIDPGTKRERLAYAVPRDALSISERLNVGLESIRICDHGGRDNSLVIVLGDGVRMCVECGTRTQVF